MTISQVQKNSALVSGANHSLAYTTAPTAGNLLVAVHTTRDQNAYSGVPTDWTEAVTSADTSTAARPRVTIAYKVAGGGESSTVVFSNTSIVGTLHIFEYSGVSVLDVVGAANSGSNQVTTQTTGTTAVTEDPESLAIGGVTFRAVFGPYELANAWTNSFIQQTAVVATSSIGTTAHKSLSATGAQETTEGLNEPRFAAGAIAVFKVATAPVLAAAQVDNVIRLTWTEG